MMTTKAERPSWAATLRLWDTIEEGVAADERHLAVRREGKGDDEFRSWNWRDVNVIVRWCPRETPGPVERADWVEVESERGITLGAIDRERARYDFTDDEWEQAGVRIKTPELVVRAVARLFE